MNTPNLIKTIRYFISEDIEIQTLFGESNSLNTRNNRIFLVNSVYTSKEGGYSYPHIGFLLDDETPILRGADDNQIPFMIEIINKFENPGAQITNLKIKDRLKLLLDENCESINTQATALGISLKLRNIFWVSGVSYDDKTQGSERLHKFNCHFMLTVGD